MHMDGLPTVAILFKPPFRHLEGVEGVDPFGFGSGVDAFGHSVIDWWVSTIFWGSLRSLPSSGKATAYQLIGAIACSQLKMGNRST